DRVAAVVQEALGDANVSIATCGTVFDATKLLEGESADLLVLDINLPLRRGNNPVRDGGLRLLKQLLQGGPRLSRPVHILGLTEFPELAEEFARDFAAHSWQVINYDPVGEAWADVLTNKLIHIAESLCHRDAAASGYRV